MAGESDFLLPEGDTSVSSFLQAQQASAARDAAEADLRLATALREAKPSFLTDGHGIRGPQPERPLNPGDPSRSIDAVIGTVSYEPRQPFFPEITPKAVTQVAAGDARGNISFQLINASTTAGNPPVTTYKVLVQDGKINGTFPTGMGFGNYILPITTPSNAIIYAGITFNPDTLAITSRFLGVSTAALFPESRVEDITHGFLYWQIGFTYLAASVFTIWQTKLGDINFEFTYGSFNNKPALLPIDSAPGWIDLDAIL